MSGLVADHVLRKHVFPLFVLTALFIAVYVVYKIVGDPVLQLIKVSWGGGGRLANSAGHCRMGSTVDGGRSNLGYPGET